MPIMGLEFLSKRLRPFAFLPAFALAYLIYHYGLGSLHWDEWGCEAPFLRAYLDGSLGAKAWLAQCNESRPVLPKIIWLLLTLISGVADPRWEMFTGCLVVGLTAWNLFRLSAGHPLMMFVVSALLFSPIQQENWLWGAQMMLFLPALFLTCWLRIARSGHRHAVAWGVALAVLATFSFPNGFLLWPALFATLGLFDPAIRKRAAVTWTLAFVATLALYFHDFLNVASAPSYTAILASPMTALQYFLNFLGGPLAAGEPSRAWFAGAALLIAFAVLLVRKSADSLPWLILAGYALASAALATIGRVALGPQQALDSRYGAFAVWLAIAVLGLAWQALQPRWRAALALLMLAAHVPSFLHGVRSMHYRTLAARYQRACLTFLNAVPAGGDCVGNYPVWSPDFLREAAAPLDRAGWIAPKMIGSGEAIPMPVVDGIGNLEAADAGPKWRFQGGVGGDPDAIIVTIVRDEKYIPIALAQPGRSVPLQVSPSAWRTEVDKQQIPPGSRVAAFAYRATEPRWSKLGGPWVAPK